MAFCASWQELITAIREIKPRSVQIEGTTLWVSQKSLYQNHIPENQFCQKEILYQIVLAREVSVTEIMQWRDCNYCENELLTLQGQTKSLIAKSLQLCDALLENNARIHLELEESIDPDMKIKIAKMFNDGRMDPVAVGPFETTLCFKPEKEMKSMVRQDKALHLLILLLLRKSNRLNFLIKSINMTVPSFLMSGLVAYECPTCNLTKDTKEELKQLKALDTSHVKPSDARRAKTVAPWTPRTPVAE